MEPKKNSSQDVHRYSKHFFLIGLSISIALVITAFEWQSEIKTKEPPPPEKTNEIVYYSVPVTIHEELPKLEKIKTKPLIIDLSKVEPAHVELKGPEKIEPETFTELPGSITVDIPRDIPQDTFLIVEKMPVPIGGYEGFYKQVVKSIKYPTIARRTGTEGKVFVEFVIDQKGDPVNFKIIKGIGQGCDEEAIRVLSKMKWEPGKQRGHPVLVKMTLPMTFKLNN